MSLFKFGFFEEEVDFTDADVIGRLEDATHNMNDAISQSPKTGNVKDIIVAQIDAYDIFFDTLFGDGAGYDIRSGKNSVKECVEASKELARVSSVDFESISKATSKYVPRNREQRRAQNKGSNHYKGRR